MIYFFGRYAICIRTSGEVVDLFIRDKVVICKLDFFIGAKLQINNFPIQSFL
jgi:hypothetical protein